MNSSVNCSPFDKLMDLIFISGISMPASINSSTMMFTFQPFGVAAVHNSIMPRPLRSSNYFDRVTNSGKLQQSTLGEISGGQFENYG